MAMGIGYRVAGWVGLALGGICFILPAAGLTLALAWAYVRFGRLPQCQSVLYGIKPVILAGLHPLAVLLWTGVLAVSIAWPRKGLRGWAATPSLWVPTIGAGGLPSVGLLGLFLFFLKLGSVLFGSGYVLLAFLKTDLVDCWHWLTQAQLLDAVAVGQVTPAPVFTTATFIGYILKGWPGALLATAGIFPPRSSSWECSA